MTKIYTRTGDTGETGLLGGVRVSKDDRRIETIGAVDELNAALGVVRMELARGGAAPPDLDGELLSAQRRLFDFGAELATPAGQPTGRSDRVRWIAEEDVLALERAIDRAEARLEPLAAFILPGGCPGGAQLHLARCVCRRAERRLVHLAAEVPVRSELVRYLNRLADLLFVLARDVNRANGVADVPWQA